MADLRLTHHSRPTTVRKGGAFSEGSRPFQLSRIGPEGVRQFLFAWKGSVEWHARKKSPKRCGVATAQRQILPVSRCHRKKLMGDRCSTDPSTAGMEQLSNSFRGMEEAHKRPRIATTPVLLRARWLWKARGRAWSAWNGSRSNGHDFPASPLTSALCRQRPPVTVDPLPWTTA